MLQHISIKTEYLIVACSSIIAMTLIWLVINVSNRKENKNDWRKKHFRFSKKLITVKGGSIVITTGALIGAGLAAAGLGVGFYFGHK